MTLSEDDAASAVPDVLAFLDGRRALPFPVAAVGTTAAEEDDDAGPAPPSASGKLTRTTQSVNFPASNCCKRRSACVGGGDAAELFELLDAGAS